MNKPMEFRFEKYLYQSIFLTFPIDEFNINFQFTGQTYIDLIVKTKKRLMQMQIYDQFSSASYQGKNIFNGSFLAQHQFA